MSAVGLYTSLHRRLLFIFFYCKKKKISSTFPSPHQRIPKYLKFNETSNFIIDTSLTNSLPSLTSRNCERPPVHHVTPSAPQPPRPSQPSHEEAPVFIQVHVSLITGRSVFVLHISTWASRDDRNGGCVAMPGGWPWFFFSSRRICRRFGRISDLKRQKNDFSLYVSIKYDRITACWFDTLEYSITGWILHDGIYANSPTAFLYL